jgi:hypothetical protein
MGLTAISLQGKTLDELFPPESVALVQPLYRRAFAGERVWFEVLLCGRDYYISAAPFITTGLAPRRQLLRSRRISPPRRNASIATSLTSGAARIPSRTRL